MGESSSERVVEIGYINHRSVRSFRRVEPLRLWFGSVKWHPGPQWIMEAFDLEKQANRSFAMNGIFSWKPMESSGFSA
jgi:predicted DNA-binding transcriptional regulator YafY